MQKNLIKLKKILLLMRKPECFVSTIYDYWNHRQQWKWAHQSLSRCYSHFQDVINRAETVEFLVRITYYIYRIWEVIKTNEKYWIFMLFGFGIFAKNCSFEFADQLIDKLQVVFESLKYF